MRAKRMLWQLFPAYLSIALLVLLLSGWLSAKSVRNFYVQQKQLDLKETALLARSLVKNRLINRKNQNLERLVREFGKHSSIRVTIIEASGGVLADTDEDPLKMENHLNRPEISKAIETGVGTAIRFSDTVGQQMMYVAVPVAQGENLLGVVRVSMSVAKINATLSEMYWNMLLGVLSIVLLAAVVSYVMSRRISKPLENMRHAAESYAAGKLDVRLPVPNSKELGELATAMNNMSAQLNEKIGTISQQEKDLDAVLSSMSEGVIAVDSNEKVININDAAFSLLGLSTGDVRGRHIQEVVRHSKLQSIVCDILATGESVESRIMLHGADSRTFEISGRVLSDRDGKIIGALVVLDDVTKLQQLENVRRDFVANVSHELRTPITSIKGFLETLLDGAMDDRGQLTRFLEITMRQAERLNAIITDLLSLSRLEASGGEARIELESGKVLEVMHSAAEVSQHRATEKNICVEIAADGELEALINPHLLEQAIVNLVDNAIKYSDEGTTVSLRAEEDLDGVHIHIKDNGCGIERQHFERLFERFYRVDKARSRELGGTGLGLAIVKHISLVHGGYVSVESIPGTGSVFSIHLCKASKN